MNVHAATPFHINHIRLSNNCDVAYIDEGKGDKTLVFIHGLATYALSWKKNIDNLKNYYRCIAIDLPGNGFSERGDYSYTMNFFAGAVYDMIVKLKLKNVCLVGHSMGGQIALTILLNESSCADKLVLCAPAGFERFTQFEVNMYEASLNVVDLFSTEENSLKKTVRNSFYHYPSQADDMIDELVNIMRAYPIRSYRHMINSCITGMLQEPVFEGLPLIKQPTLVIFGERDALIPNKVLHATTTRKIAESGVTQMPHATLNMIPSCGHFVQWERAEEVNALINDFV
jgi:pimeloyl-ACP methyl ester carboxylesterase